MLQVGPGAPLAALGWETGVMDMGLRVAKEKVLMVLHLRQLGEDTLAGSIYREQVARGWPGLAQEVKDICTELKIEDANTTGMLKEDFKSILNLACMSANEQILRKLAQNKSKCSTILKEVCGKKKYMENMKIQEVRKCFKARTMMLPFAGNYAADRRYAKSGWLCRCGVREEEEHIRAGRCPLYRDIWAEYDDLQDTDNLVSFLTRVLDRREQVEELDREEKEQERAELQPPVFASPLMGTSQSSDVCRLD